MTNWGILSKSVADRPLPFRMRRDLVTQRQMFGARQYWVVKDPIALRYFHLTDEEFGVLHMLDGKASTQEVQNLFAKQFTPRRLQPERLQVFLKQLHHSGLIVSDAVGQGEQLHLRRGEVRRQYWVNAAANLLSFRFRGIDPERLLSWLSPKCRWMFSPWFAITWVLLLLAAILQVTIHFDDLHAKLPDTRAFLGPGNAMWILAVMVAIKTVHELGHALACKYFGGECHEIGVQLLLMTPCPYCNVSDAWMLANKWHRMAISAAGMYVEIFVASICTFLWWFSEPGLLNSLCLNTMFVCSVGTLFFNGNPLLRSDGYYILSDFLEIPNLETRARDAARRWGGAWFLGIDGDDDPAFDDRRSFFLPFYSNASKFYRVFILGTVYFVLLQVLAPYHLQMIADAVAVAAIAGLILPPLVALGRFLGDPNMRQQIEKRRMATTGVVLLAAVFFIAFVPLPFRVAAPVMLELENARRVYAIVPGTLLETVSTGDVVETGQILGRFDNPKLRRELLQLESERDNQLLQIDFLETRRASDSTAAANLPTAREGLASLEQRIEQLKSQIELLTPRSPIDGTVVRQPLTKTPPLSPGQLSAWEDTPLDAKNRGAFIDAGTLICLVGDPSRMEVVAIVDQQNIDFVGEGLSAKVQLDLLPGVVLAGKVQEVSRLDIDIEPLPLVAAGMLPGGVDSHGRPRRVTTSYKVRIAFDEKHAGLLPGGIGRCKISASSQSIGRRLYRYLAQTFRFTAPS